MFTWWSEVTQLDVLGHSARGAVTAAWVPAETLGPRRAGRNGGSAARDVWNVDSKLKRESEASTVSFALFHLASTYKETCFSSEFIGLQRQGIISYPNDKHFTVRGQERRRSEWNWEACQVLVLLPVICIAR